jgi:signal transduction histidine kinase
MSRLDVESNILNGVATGGLIMPVARWVSLVVGSLLIVCLVAGLILLEPQDTLWFSSLLFTIPLAASVLAIGAVRWWLPPGPYLTTMAFMLPVCGWRRLNILGVHVVERLKRFQPSANMDSTAHNNLARGNLGSSNNPIVLLLHLECIIVSLQHSMLKLLHGHPAPMLLVGGDGEIIQANKLAERLSERVGVQALSGTAAAPLLALIGPCADIAADEHPGQAQPCALPDEPRESRWRGQSFEGDPLEVRFVPTFFSPIEPAAFFVEITTLPNSLTDSREKETIVRQREEALQLLSHDMRSPQITILAMIAKGDLDKVDLGVRHRVERQVRKTIHLAESFVRLAHAESDAYTLAPVDLGHLLEEAVDEVWALARSGGVNIKLEPWSDEYIVLADRTLIIRALINLLDNAIKFSPSGAWVVAGLSRVSLNGRPGIACSIADQAGGMDAKQVNGLFTRFATFRRGPDDSIGVGLGLATVRTVINRHEGEVTCESSLGVGSVFIIKLPLCTLPEQDIRNETGLPIGAG